MFFVGCYSVGFLQARGIPLLGGFIVVMTAEPRPEVDRLRPAYGVADDAQNMGIIIGGIGFVAGLEIKNLTGSPVPAAAGRNTSPPLNQPVNTCSSG